MATPISLINSSLLLNGIPVTGFSGDEDALSISDDGVDYVTKDGVDCMAVGLSGSKGGKLTIKLQANSISVPVMQAFALSIRNGVHVKFQGLISYDNGSATILTDGFLINSPKGHTIGNGVPKVMTYVISFEAIYFETITGKYG